MNPSSEEEQLLPNSRSEKVNNHGFAFSDHRSCFRS